ncbi:MAG: STAS domain-containing protein [Planctomycetota bacterium]
MISSERQGAVDVIKITGRLDTEQIGGLAKAVGPLLKPGVRVVIDLSRVTVADGAGLEWLLDVLDEAVALGGEVKLAAATPLIDDVLGMTGVGDRFDRHGSVLCAVGGFA